MVQRKLKKEMTGPDLLVRRDLVRLPQDPEIVFNDIQVLLFGTALTPTQWGSEIQQLDIQKH